MNLELNTERLALKPLAAADIDLCVDLFTDPVVVKYAGEETMGEAEIGKEMSVWTKRGGNGCIGIWCIRDRETGEKCGTVALLPIPIEEDDTDFSLVVAGEMPRGDIEVGYFIKPAAWGRGYATEACRRIIQYAFEETPLNEVVATFEEENVASKHVLVKAGFSDHGTRRCYGEEGIDYRITRDEWAPRAQ